MNALRGIKWVWLAIVRSFGKQEASATTSETIEYRGWQDAIELRNDVARVVVVPAVGRILHYGKVGGANLLFVDPQHLSKVNDSRGAMMVDGKPDWIAYGGDRVWPTEEDRFAEVNGARRPPDWFFDGMPWNARIDGDEVVMECEVSEFCGAKVVRRISLAEDSARVTIRQTLTKVRLGKRENIEPIPLTIWNISTLRLPEQIFFPLNPDSCFDGQVLVPEWPDLLNRGAENVHREQGIGVFLPNNVDQKVAADAPNWIAAIVGDEVIVERFEFDPQREYPDGGTSVSAYLNPNLGEVECLSPMMQLKPGESLDHSVVWDLGSVGSGTLAERRRAGVKWIETLGWQAG